jgi:hypothetical protein
MRFYCVTKNSDNIDNLRLGLKKAILEYFKCPRELNNEWKSHDMDEEKMINDMLQFLQNLDERFLYTFLTLMMNFYKI